MLTVDFNLLPINSGERVIDIGCGAGRHSWYVCSKDHCTVYGMDMDQESLQKARWVLTVMHNEDRMKAHWHLLMGDTQTLPFPDRMFDKIICSEVLEHVIDDEKGVRELVRVLKDGGLMAVSVPCFYPESIYWKISEAYHTNPGGHIRIYKENELIDLLTRNNLKLYAVRYKHAFHSIYWFLKCLCGVKNEKALLPRIYHKFLVWEMENERFFVGRIESFLDNFFPKSVVIYVQKPAKH